MQTRIAPRHMRYAFDSLGELGAYIERTPRKWRQDGSKTHDSDPEWSLGDDYKTCVALARDGWMEGARRAQEALKAFMPATPQPDTKTDFYGFRPHVPRFCAGAPDSMIRHAEVATAGSSRVLTLAVPVNALAYVSARSMANFGIAVAQYVNQLETDGTRVELIGMIVSMVHDVRVAHSWTIKHADQPLDLAVVAFAIGHPGMFRRLGFALRERCDAREMQGYGQSTAAKASDLINEPPGVVVLNGMRDADTHASTPARALEYVSKQIEAALKAQEL
jgi:hypothetical protein